MKGKKLFSLIKGLSKPERHQVLNSCKRSGDKRHKALYDFLKGSYNEESRFEESLNKISNFLFDSKEGRKKLNEKEKDKNLRRFIDFSVKELENLKMQNLLKEDQLLRNYLMSIIYSNSPSTDLFTEYSKKTLQEAKKSKDLYITSKALEMEIQVKYLSQTEKNLSRVSEAAAERVQVINDLYHHSLSSTFNVLSSCALDDKKAMANLESFVDEYEINQIIDLGGQRFEVIEYKIAEMRMVFENPERFRALNSEAEEMINSFNLLEKNKLSIQRRLMYLQGLFVFHQGSDLKEYLLIEEELMKINFKLYYPDSFAFFYYLLGLAINNQEEKIEEVIKGYGELFIREETSYMFEFIQAYRSLFNGDLSKAIKRLNLLSYAPNYYIASWSRLLELKAHYLKGNAKFCENLIQRMVRFEQKNPTRVFTKNANLFILSEFAKKLGKPELTRSIQLEERPTLSFMHQKYEDWLKEDFVIDLD
jgi:hypothetical protein